MRRTIDVPVAGILALLLLPLVPPERALSQAPTAPPVDAARAAEVRGLGLEAQGRFADALAAYQEALRTVADLAARAPADQRPLLLARAEVYVHRIDFFTGKLGDTAQAVATFQGIASDDRLPPTTRDLARHDLLGYRRAAGDVDGAAEEARRLGCIVDWLICGPFDNERGAGYGTPNPPEREVNLDATYRGDRREVRWAPIACPPVDGVVDLDALLRPNDQTLAYALAYVHVDAACAAAIRVATDDAIKVFVNDVAVIERDIQRGFRLDQDVAGVTLDAGWNKILVKSCDREGTWRFLLRLTAPDGAPLAGWRLATADEIRGGLGTGSVTGRVPASRGAIDVLEDAASRSSDPWVHYYLGYLRIRRAAHDENEHPDQQALQRAVDLDPQNPYFRLVLSLVVGQTGTSAVHRDLNQRREVLEQAIRLLPDYPEAHFLLGDYYLTEVQLPEKAMRHAAAALRTNPDYLDAIVLMARAHEARRMGALAWDLIRRTMAAGRLSGHPSLILLEAKRLQAAGDLAGALAAGRRALAADETDEEAASLVDDILYRTGDGAGLVAFRRDRIRYYPQDAGRRLALARSLLGMDDLAGAEEALLQGIRIVPEADDLWTELGEIRHLAGNDDGAIEAFEEALRLNPNLADLERYVQFMRADEVPFEREFQVDPAEVARAAAATPVDPEVSYRVLLDNAAVRLFEDGTKSEYQELVCRIENPQGVQEYDTYGIPWAAGEQRARVLRAEVIHADGRRENARIQNRDSGEASEFTTYQWTGVDLPPLVPGDVVAIEFRRDDLERGFFGDYWGDTVSFQRDVPVVHARFALVRPLGREIHVHDRGTGLEPTRRQDPQAGTETLVWETQDLPRIEPEPRMPPMGEVVPSLQLSTYGDWGEFGRWYWNLVRRQYQVTDEMRDMIGQLTAGRSTVIERIRAIYDFVVTDVRYNDRWEFGVHGFKPYSSATIFSRRFGDCKDKATLINVMLSEIGVTAYPVLIQGAEDRPRQDLTLPLISHFNHVISYVPPQDGVPDGLFLDGTAQYHPMGTLPAMDYGARVVVITPGGGEIHEIPYPDPAWNRIEEDHRLNVSRQASGETTGTDQAAIRPHGNFDPVVRAWLENEGDRVRQIERLMGSEIPGARVSDVTTTDLHDLSSPIEVRCRVEVPTPTQPAPGGGSELRQIRSIIFSRMEVQRMSDLASLAERHYDVLLPTPSSVVEHTTYDLPDGFTVDRLPETQEIRSEFGVFRKTYRVEGRQVTVIRELDLLVPRVEVDRYEAFRRFANDVDEADEAKIVIRPGRASE